MAREKSKAINLKDSKLVNAYDKLATRDKIALFSLSLFLFCVFGVYGGYYVHKNLEKQQSIFDNKLTDYFWMRGQSGNLSSSQLANGDTDSVVTTVTTLIKSAGINKSQVTPTNDGVQFSFEHSSQALVSRILSNIQNKQLSFTRLQISQMSDTGNFRVEAVITL